MSFNLAKAQHWYFDAQAFQPTDAQLNLLLDLLPKADQAKVIKYRHLKDQKLSLISALIQRAKIRHTFACSNEEFCIKRTSHNKPFVSSELIPILDWNYNVSHHGSYVTILSDHFRPIGVDLVERSVRPNWKGSAAKYITQFNSQLTETERGDCLRYTKEWERYTHFFVIWSLKEAYIKAVGKGLYMDLLSVSFDVTFQILSCNAVSGVASARIHGRERRDWEFNFSSVDAEHVVTVAKGPIGKGNDELQTQKSYSSLTEVTILDLLSPKHQANWNKLKVVDEQSQQQWLQQIVVFTLIYDILCNQKLHTLFLFVLHVMFIHSKFASCVPSSIPKVTNFFSH